VKKKNRITMKATLRPSGALKAYIGGKTEITIEAGHTVRETLSALNIPPEVVALVVVNEEQQTKEYFLQEGDVVRVLAVIGGG
jgi:sulfur carrier protein ThiS